MKIVVAYSGGLDTSVLLLWLKEKYNAEIIAYCREHLSSIKCPRSVDFNAELPRHENGKLYKRKLRDPWWQGRDRAI